jgi:hypothetical protein
MRTPKDVDEDFQRRWYLPAARIIEIEAFERRWGPVVGNGDEAAIGKHWRKIDTRKLHQPDSIRYGPGCKCAVIDDQRAVRPSLKA